MQINQGKSVYSGIAIGKIRVYKKGEQQIRRVQVVDIEFELERFEEAKASTKREEARANVIQAEAEVPKAMAEAFRTGNLGIMDYYRMKNIQADTDMRESIARPDGLKTDHPLGE